MHAAPRLHAFHLVSPISQVSAHAPWARDVRVRQAVAHTVDRQLIVDTLLYGFTTPAYTSITPELAAFRNASRADSNRLISLPGRTYVRW